MQTNGVTSAIKRVSSDEIKRNYTQITGREALERLLAGETVYFSSGTTWKIEEFELRGTHNDGRTFTVTEDLSSFLDPTETNWYVAPPFDARKEMLARPGEWVAKFASTGDGRTIYIGFDFNAMSVVESALLENNVDYDPIADIFFAYTDDINRAIPLDDADLAKLASLSKEGE